MEEVDLVLVDHRDVDVPGSHCYTVDLADVVREVLVELPGLVPVLVAEGVVAAGGLGGHGEGAGGGGGGGVGGGDGVHGGRC